jgi:membrane-associated protease RseP (regulator of RpoE activity)
MSYPPVERWANSSPPGLEFPSPSAKFRDRRWLHALLLALTALTTTLVGLGHYAAFLSELGARTVTAGWASFGYGAWYSATILAILGAHEMGHYLACRYYRVDASLPYFIPAVGVLTGTFGAVIRIREPILYKRALFDIGIAGPIAGFVVAVPALFVGLMLSNVVPLPRDFQGLELGEPLLFQAASWLVWGTPAPGLTVNIHPMAFAAWFGLLATALNLFPIAQLDGGHISYAALGRRSTYVTYGALLCAAALTLVSLSWLVWTVMIVAMLFIAGPRHPPVMDEAVPLDKTRQWLAVFAIVMFALCFTPAPIELFDLVPR